mgnify:CR=1 FL=1
MFKNCVDIDAITIIVVTINLVVNLGSTAIVRFNAALRIIRKLIVENRDGKTECACFDGVWLTIIVLLKSATRDKKKEVQI